jgi:hypothetical protein
VVLNNLAGTQCWVYMDDVNRLKRAYDTAVWKPKCEGRTLRKKSRITDAKGEEEIQSDENETLIEVAPWLTIHPPDEQVPSPTQGDAGMDSPEGTAQPLDTPHSEREDLPTCLLKHPRRDAKYRLLRAEPPVTRSRSRLYRQYSQDNVSMYTTRRTKRNGLSVKHGYKKDC